MITLEKLEAKQTELSALIEKFKAQKSTLSLFPISIPFPELNEGEEFAGAIVRPNGSTDIVILLPGEMPGKANFKDCAKWAKSVGGVVPDKLASALLFETMNDKLQKDYYWTSSLRSEGDAFVQHFSYGHQIWDYILDEARCRAVRLIQLNPLAL